jgi:hypothetical protein
MSNILHNGLDQSVHYKNNSRHTSVNRAVDLLASKSELYKTFLVVIMEKCGILLVEIVALGRLVLCGFLRER